MNRIHLSISNISSPGFNTTVAGSFGIHSPADLMHIPEKNGRGLLYRKKIDEELLLLYWNFMLNKKLSFHKKVIQPAEKNRSISIIYILKGDIVAGETFPETFRIKHDKSVLVVPAFAELKFEVPSDTPVLITAVDIGDEWLSKEISGSGKQYEMHFKKLYKKLLLSPQLFTITLEELQLLAMIDKLVNTGTGNIFVIKVQVFQLISAFFARFIHGNATTINPQRAAQYDQMVKLENILKEHLEKKLPELPVLASQLYISVSTLKRHFKKVFGKNIYEYYLTLKMNYAMQLLEEKKMQVHEVAYLLQYENVSGFIEMFKRHHGVSPGSLLK